MSGTHSAMRRRMQRLVGRVFGLILAASILAPASATTTSPAASDYAVQVSAVVQPNPPQIRLVWPEVEGSTGYSVERRARPEPQWGQAFFLSGLATTFLDTDVTPGTVYEYHVRRTSTNYVGHGYVLAGIEVPLVETRGKIILLVEQTHAAPLAVELGRLQQDLVGDGWMVVRHDVPRLTVPAGATDPALWETRRKEVAAVKDLIRNEYLAAPDQVKAVLILGHIPVPYSGALAPDEHPDHRGAWPADVYYADMRGTWTDSTVQITSASDIRNQNVPGDGKFDQSELYAAAALQVGRVDFANLPSFPPEQDLLRQYLEKNHQFRHRLFTVQPRALIDDNLGVSNSEAAAYVGWVNFAPLVGSANIATGRWLSTLQQQDYLWGYASGPGQYGSLAGVAESVHFLAYDTRVVFTLLFGSYFGDWDSENNLLRAQLATRTYTLATAWGGRPAWYFHQMGLGGTIGESAQLTQNNTDFYAVGSHSVLFGGRYARGTHIALLGDPTLRLHPAAPPSSLTAMENAQGGVDLSWTPANEPVLGYLVYRAPHAGGPYTRLNQNLLGGTSYSDGTVGSDRFYMVRAVQLQQSSSGSYQNASQGIFVEANLTAPTFDDRTWAGRNIKTWTMTDAAGTPGSYPGWDFLKTDWLIDVTATELNRFTIRIASYGPDNNPGPPANFDPALRYEWLLVNAAGTISNFDPAKIHLDTTDFRADLKGGTFHLELSADRRSLSLVFTPNQPPLAAPASLQRAPGASLRIGIDVLLERFTSDPEGDGRALLEVRPVSTSSGLVIQTDEAFVLVTGGTNFFETLSYTIQDLRPYRSGDTPRTATGTITIETNLGDGGVQAVASAAYRAIEVEWESELGKLYQVQSRIETAADWVDHGEPVVGTGQRMSVFERANNGNKFYRVVPAH